MQPRNIHMNAATDLVENVTFMYCPPERTVQVAVPVRVCSRFCEFMHVIVCLSHQCSKGLYGATLDGALSPKHAE